MQNILITGANRGVGLELARQYLTRGETVFAGCRQPGEARQLQRLREAYRERLTILPLDVTDEDGLKEASRMVKDQASSLDVLFNNAAINLGDENIRSAKAGDLMESLRVNAVGPVLVVKQFLDLLKKGKDPRIINVSSESGSISRMRHPRGYGYYASKAALNMYTRALAVDHELDGIIVISIHPGWVRTDMGGPHATLSPEESVLGMLRVIDKLSMADDGKFYTYTGEEYPW
jgi:NAD(P)-dependent dehydrogenase (short-subunit alcohol dehydrogenase family)